MVGEQQNETLVFSVIAVLRCRISSEMRWLVGFFLFPVVGNVGDAVRSSSWGQEPSPALCDEGERRLLRTFPGLFPGESHSKTSL